MTERLTPEEIEELRERSREVIGSIPVTSRELNCLLRAYQLVDRLRTLQAEDVTGAQMQAVEHIIGVANPAWDFVREGDLIAAAVRVMVASLDKNADSE